MRECHQGVLGDKVAEERLRESQKEFAYLTRESDIKRGRFIVSNLTKTGQCSTLSSQIPLLRRTM